MKLALLIAKRFMLGGKGSGASRFTGWIAIIGLAVGCFALIISVAVLNGFETRVMNKIMGFEGDLRLVSTTGEVILTEQAQMLIEKELIDSYMPFVQRKGLIVNNFDDVRMVEFKAVDFDKLPQFYDLGIDSVSSEPGIYVGRLLAQRLSLMPGDWLRLYSPIDSPVSIGLPRTVRLPVKGIFRVDVLDYDDRICFIPLSSARRLFTRKQGLDGIDLRWPAISDESHQRKLVEAALSEGVITENWGERHQGLFSAMRMERIGAIIVLSLIVLVASFNLSSTLALITFQKVREIGILRTIGVDRRGIRRIILAQGMIIGGLGAATGLVVSLAVVFIQQQTGFLPLPAEIYIIDAVPMLLFWQDLVIIPLIAFSLVFGASLIASNRATLINPKDAVQMEK